jgi:hypothetical protein
LYSRRHDTRVDFKARANWYVPNLTATNSFHQRIHQYLSGQIKLVPKMNRLTLGKLVVESNTVGVSFVLELMMKDHQAAEWLPVDLIVRGRGGAFRMSPTGPEVA